MSVEEDIMESLTYKRIMKEAENLNYGGGCGGAGGGRGRVRWPEFMKLHKWLCKEN